VGDEKSLSLPWYSPGTRAGGCRTCSCDVGRPVRQWVGVEPRQALTPGVVGLEFQLPGESCASGPARQAAQGARRWRQSPWIPTRRASRLWPRLAPGAVWPVVVIPRVWRGPPGRGNGGCGL
jgi:hypothetical protein